MKYTKVCPFCGGIEVDRSDLEPNGHIAWRLCACGCGKVWTEVFELVSIEEMTQKEVVNG